MMMLNPDMTDREKFRAVFKALRKQGVTALQSYKCCSSCALYALTEEKGLKDDDNFIFYHRQDADSFRRDRLERPIMIRHGGPLAPALAVIAFRLAGFDVRWDGSEYRCVEVHPGNPFKEQR